MSSLRPDVLEMDDAKAPHGGCLQDTKGATEHHLFLLAFVKCA